MKFNIEVYLATSLSYISKTGHYYEENAMMCVVCQCHLYHSCVYNTVQCVSLNPGLAPEREQEQFAIVSLVVITFLCCSTVHIVPPQLKVKPQYAQSCTGTLRSRHKNRTAKPNLYENMKITIVNRHHRQSNYITFTLYSH